MVIDTLIEDKAWRTIQKTDNSVTAKKYRLDLNWDHVTIDHTTQYAENGRSHSVPDCDVDFSSEFVNDTKVTQEYTFRAETMIRVATEATLVRGFLLQQRFQLRLEVPKAVRADSSMTTKLSFNQTDTEREEKSVSLSIDNKVSVPTKRQVRAGIKIKQFSYENKFTIKSSLSGFVDVSFVNRKTGKADHELHHIDVTSLFREEELQAMTKESRDRFIELKPNVRGNSLLLESSGTCRFNYAKQHEVNLKESEITG